MSALPAEPAPEIRVAIVVNPELPLGPLANAAAVIGVGLGAARPMLGAVELTDADGRTVSTSADRPVPILQAGPDQMRELLRRALPAPDGAVVVPFPEFARSIHTFEEYLRVFPEKRLTEEAPAGLGLLGPAKWVRSLTGSLKSLR